MLKMYPFCHSINDYDVFKAKMIQTQTCSKSPNTLHKEKKTLEKKYFHNLVDILPVRILSAHTIL